MIEIKGGGPSGLSTLALCLILQSSCWRSTWPRQEPRRRSWAGLSKCNHFKHYSRLSYHLSRYDIDGNGSIDFNELKRSVISSYLCLLDNDFSQNNIRRVRDGRVQSRPDQGRGAVQQAWPQLWWVDLSGGVHHDHQTRSQLAQCSTESSMKLWGSHPSNTTPPTSATIRSPTILRHSFNLHKLLN